MFTGIIEDQGIVKTFKKFKDYQLVVSSKNKFKGIKKGSSICCDGVCLTVHTIKRLKNKTELSFDVSQETVNCSNMGDLKSNYKINLERSLRLGDEISGHFVFGHVDETAIISKISPVDDSHLLCIKVSSKVSKFLVKKGSVAINGVSLTINDVKKSQIFINIIPFTWKHTNLRFLKPGSRINLEVDMLARYVTKNLKK